MRVYSTPITNYRNADKAFWPVHFISFLVKEVDDSDSLVRANFCTFDDDMTITITDPDTGLPDERTFGGGGHIVKMGDLIRSEGAIIRKQSLTLAGASTLVRDLVHGYNCKEALFHWFIGEMDQDTGLLIDEPPCEFVGYVDTIEFNQGALSIDGIDAAESTYTVSVDSLGAKLTDLNYDMRDYDVGLSRGGDKFFEYSDSAHHWNIRWGKGKKREKDGKDRNGHKGKAGNGGSGRVRANK